MKLADKVAIVTGGASGIGKAIVKRFFDEGARVVVADRNDAAAEALARSLGAGAFNVSLDVTKQESIDQLVRVVTERAGGIDILVNCAAIYALTPLTEVPRETMVDNVFHQRRRHVFHHASSRETDDKAGARRQDYQFGEPGRPAW
jgi:NAD(P)-dependent dehydrogenase (short-subunit alcohol dehydrogenase family)